MKPCACGFVVSFAICLGACTASVAWSAESRGLLIYDCRSSGKQVQALVDGSRIMITMGELSLGSGELSDELPPQYEGLYLRSAKLSPDRSIAFDKLRNGRFRLIIKDALAGDLFFDCQ
jgi:hypothetical protein